MDFRDRVRELRYVNAVELTANRKNWRRHPPRQRAALRAALARIGFANAVIAYETDDGKLKVIDGHLRTELSIDDEVPVLVLDVTDQEADELLATLDPIGRMATEDEQRLDALLRDTDVEITGLIHELPLDEDDDAKDDGAEPEPEEDPGTVMRFGDTTIRMTADEFVRLEKVRRDYSRDHDGMAGFFGWLVTHTGVTQ